MFSLFPGKESNSATNAGPRWKIVAFFSSFDGL
jgi:hypothetical protein